MTKAIHISDELHKKLKKKAIDSNKSLQEYVEGKLDE
jgi:predicted HicB family RNase H-like nuclease